MDGCTGTNTLDVASLGQWMMKVEEVVELQAWNEIGNGLCLCFVSNAATRSSGKQSVEMVTSCWLKANRCRELTRRIASQHWGESESSSAIQLNPIQGIGRTDSAVACFGCSRVPIFSASWSVQRVRSVYWPLGCTLWTPHDEEKIRALVDQSNERQPFLPAS